MPLETATYISSLDTANPTAVDAKSQGDDHIRLLKSTIKNTFPNVSGATTSTHTQLNYVTGVTSALQTQLDAKLTNAGPLLDAYHAASGGNIPDNAYTLLPFDTEVFDTANCFTASAFTPTTAGYYQVNCSYAVSPASPFFLAIFKTGVLYKRGAWVNLASASVVASVSGLVKCNGTTDTIDIRAYQNTGALITVLGGATICWLNIHYVRAP